MEREQIQKIYIHGVETDIKGSYIGKKHNTYREKIQIERKQMEKIYMEERHI